MKILPLRDNALFIRNWRERMRPVTVVCSALVVFLLIALIFVGFYLNLASKDVYDYNTRSYINIPLLNKVFFNLTVLQGVMLLLFGTFFVNKMASSERLAGTLDSHRSSPTSRLDQVIGLVFGSASLEWCLFFATLPVVFFIVVIAKISLLGFFVFYLSFAFYVVFLHSLAVLVALNPTLKPEQTGFAPLVFLLWIFVPAVSSFALSSMYHLTWFPSYDYIWKLTSGLDGARFNWQKSLLYEFFGFKLPFPILQLAVQLPLLALTWSSIKRKISSSEKFLLSKTKFAVLSFLLLFYYSGSAVSVALNGVKYFYKEQYLFLFFAMAFFLMIGGSLNSTPSYLNYIKGLRKLKKLGLKRAGYSDDHDSNIMWLAVFCAIVSLFYFVLNYFIKTDLILQILYLIIILSQIVSFGSSWEFFRLSRYRQKKISFWTVIIIFWCIVPLFGLVTKSMAQTPAYPGYFLSLSPFFWWTIFNNLSKVESLVMFTVYINFILAVVMLVLAHRQRNIIREEDEK